jgi:hypothetical protein
MDLLRSFEKLLLIDRLGRRMVLASDSDRRGTSVLFVATKVCDGFSSGTIGRRSKYLSMPDGCRPPNTLTPPTCFASIGPDITNAFDFAMLSASV